MTDMPPSTNDRFDAVVTTALDTLAILAVAAGVAFWLLPFGLGPALIFSGLSLAAMSTAVQLAHRPRAPRRAPAAPRLPGPEHPGTVHVSGR